MTQDRSDRLKGTIKGDAGRRQRLAAELRANLRRRKAQARRPDGEAAEAVPPGEAKRGPADDR
jgi:hypothetical protein